MSKTEHQDPARQQGEASPTIAETPLARAESGGIGTGLMHRKLARRLARRGADENGVSPDAEAQVAQASSSGGSPLPAALQRKFEGSLGADLSGVRVHTGEESAAAAEA